jgi:NAD(P)-dependent dehydrogenase (short-subunit alcohol dehydrogenase family)
VDLQLKGHRAIVTGSSAGIGEAIARRLAAEGAAVIVHGRRAHAVSAVAEAISADGGQAEGLTADLADPGDCTRLISRALAGGDVDILVNNAGAFANRGWDAAAPEDWLALYATNVAAVVRCIQGFLPAMRASGWGRIVQIGTGEAVNHSRPCPITRRPRPRCSTSPPRWPSTWTAPASRSTRSAPA